MDIAEASGALALVGLTAAAVGLVALLGPLPEGAAFVCVALGTSYVTVAVVAVVADERAAVPLWLAAAPAGVTAAVAVLVAHSLDFLATSNPVVPALVAGGFAAITLPYALGTTARRRERLVVLLLLLAAITPVLAVGGWAAFNFDAEEGGLLLAFAVAVFAALVPPAVPNYLLGRVVCRQVRGADPPDRTSLSVAAVPFALALVPMLAMPWFVFDLVFGPAVALLVVAALVTIGVAYRRIPA